MDYALFTSIFILIFVAELPDKTAFATLLMATRSKPLPVFTGVALAFVIQSLVAVAFGRVISFLPEKWVHLLAGLLFLAFSAFTLLQKDESEEAESGHGEFCERTSFIATAWKSFVVIFIAEWGDLTQLATASLAARYPTSLATVFFASTLALWSVTALAVFLGSKLKHVIPTQFLVKASASVFLCVGIYFIITWAIAN